MLLAGVLMFVFADQIASFGNNSESTRPFVAQYLRIAAFGLSFVGLETILTGSLQACEDTKFPLLIGFICSWAISIPVTYVLAITFHMQSQGAWIALLVANLVAGLAMLARFAVRPEWKKHTNEKELAAAVAGDASAQEPNDSSAEPSAVPSQRPCVEIAIPEYATAEIPINPAEPPN
jgi:Na+-driven multidrug efflux pump